MLYKPEVRCINTRKKHELMNSSGEQMIFARRSDMIHGKWMVVRKARQACSGSYGHLAKRGLVKRLLAIDWK